MENLIAAGEQLLNEANFNKSKLKMWQINGSRVLSSEIDDEIAKEFNKIFNKGSVIYPGMSMYQKVYKPRIVEALDLLREVATTTLPPMRVAEEPKVMPSHISVSGGNLIIGDNAVISNVTVQDVITTLSKEIESKAPAGEQKQKALAALKEISKNETVANVVGQTLGAFLSHLTK